MNIKKLFAILAGVSMVANVVIPGLAHAATPDTELGKAYEWAYSKSITTMPSYEAANMKGKVTRAELAKMLSNWAMNVRGMTPDTSKTCEFTDTASVKGDLGPAITTSCQLGLMGQGIPAFRPYDNVSRAEFGTALSRALWGGKYDGGTPYYKNHLQALKAAGIMNYIDGNWPASQEVRGYVMLMLMRVAEGETADPETPSDEVVKSGDLSVTATPAEGRKAIVSVSGAVSDLDTLTFKTSEKVDLTKVVLERYGYSSADDVDEIRLEDQDGNVIADGKSLSKDKATLSIKKDYRAIDGTLKATVVAKLTGNNVGGTIGFKVVDVESTAKNLNLDNYTPYTYDMVAYSGNTVTVDIKGTKKDYNYEEGQSYEVARLQVKAGSSIIYVKGFTLTNASGLDMAEFLDKLTVKVDGKDVAGLKYSVNKDDQLVISFDEMTVEMNKRALFVISASFKDFDDYGEGVAYYLKSTSDINATEKKTGARLTVNGTALTKDNAILHVFNGGKIKLSNNKLGKLDASQGAENLVVAEGNVKVTEPISKLGFTVNANGSGAKFVTALRMFVDGDEFEAKKSGTAFTFSNVEIAKSGKIQFKIDIEDNDAAQGSGISFEPNFNGDAFADSKYDNSRETVNTGDVSGTISFSNVTIQPARATLKSNTSSLKDPTEFLNGETTSNDVFKGTYTAKKALINLNKVYMSGAANPDKVKVTYYVYLNGEEEYVAAVDSYGTGGEEIFDDVLVEAGKSVDVRVEAEVEAYGNTGSIAGVQVVLGGTDEFGKDVEYKAGKLVEMKIVENGSVNVEAGASKNTVYKTSSNQPLAEFTVKAANTATTELTELVFTVKGTGDFEPFGKDDIDVSPIDMDDCKYAEGKFTCTELTEKLPSTVSISFNTQKRGEYIVTLDSVNGKKQSRTFSKRFEKAIVSIATNEKQGNNTKFTLNVDLTDTSIEVSNVKIYASGTELQGPYAHIIDVFSNGAELVVANGDKVQFIDGISYHWELDASNSGDVRINQSIYADFFKVGNDYAQVFKTE